MSIATENFLKAIYQLNHQGIEDCKTGNVAKRLGVSNAAATDMAKKLAVKDLLTYQKYQPLVLTDKGVLVALNIIRKHRLWETFLHKVFGLNMHEIHREAEGLEHQTSDFLAERINEYLDFPKIDPHGDPIPSADGTIEKDILSISLKDAEVNSNYLVVRLISEDKEFFDFCDQNGIRTQAKIKVVRQFKNSGLTEIEIDDRTILLPLSFTEIIHLHKHD